VEAESNLLLMDKMYVALIPVTFLAVDLTDKDAIT
jgi:hypothetical protein